MAIQHIKNCLEGNPFLRHLREKLGDNKGKTALLSLLSPLQKQEVLSVVCKKDYYLVRLKRAYALYAIRHSLKNFHAKVRIVVSQQE